MKARRRIPLLMKAPPASPFAAQFNRGAVVTNIVENIDVMPTLCEMARRAAAAAGHPGPQPDGAGGRQGRDWKDRAFAERGSTMVRTPQYKLIRNARKARRDGGEYELYDLTEIRWKQTTSPPTLPTRRCSRNWLPNSKPGKRIVRPCRSLPGWRRSPSPAHPQTWRKAAAPNANSGEGPPAQTQIEAKPD